MTSQGIPWLIEKPLAAKLVAPAVELQTKHKLEGRRDFTSHCHALSAPRAKGTLEPAFIFFWAGAQIEAGHWGCQHVGQKTLGQARDLATQMLEPGDVTAPAALLLNH